MKSSSIAAGVAAAIWAAGAGAAELTYGVNAGVGTSDNIRHVPTGEESETMLTAGVELSFLREEGRVHADVDVDLSYLDYQDQTYNGEIVGMANADLRALFVPGRFEWVLTDSFGQSALDPFSASTPDNRENINYFTTGPDFTIHLGSATGLTLFARWSATQFETSNFDDQRTLGGLSLARDLSARSNVSVNATAERVEFDDTTVGSDYDRQSAFLRYEATGVRTTLSLEGGYTEIHDQLTTSSSPLFDINLTRNLSQRSVLTLTGGIRSSDEASALRAGNVAGGGGSPGGPDTTSTADPFETRHVSLGWHFTTPRTTLLLSAGYEDNAYQTDNLLDRQRQIYLVSASRQITPRVGLRGQATLMSTTFDVVDQDDDETRYGLYLTWNLTGRLFMDVDLEKLSRDSTNVLTEYDETRAFIRFAWRNSRGAPGPR